MTKRLPLNQNSFKIGFQSASSILKRNFTLASVKRWLRGARRQKFDLLHDRLLELWRHEGKDFFFIQIGANDGESNDPIHKFVRSHYPAGLLIEPLPDIFEKLQMTYPKSEYSKLSFFNGAIHESEKEVLIFRIARSFESTYRELYKKHKNPSGVSSLSKDHVKSFLLRAAPEYFQEHDVEGAIECSRVPACDIVGLCECYGISRVSFVQVDAEGYDGVIVNMILDTFGTKLPLCINFESRSLLERERNELFERLHNHGYRLFHERSDTCAMLASGERMA